MGPLLPTYHYSSKLSTSNLIYQNNQHPPWLSVLQTWIIELCEGKFKALQVQRMSPPGRNEWRGRFKHIKRRTHWSIEHTAASYLSSLISETHKLMWPRLWSLDIVIVKSLVEPFVRLGRELGEHLWARQTRVTLIAYS